MADHKILTDPELHEPKGISTAVADTVYVADGSGSGTWTNLSSITAPDADNIDDSTTTNKFVTQAQIDKLSGIESGATADMTGNEIKLLYEAEGNTNAYTDIEKSKLAGIESGATSDQTGAEIKTLYEAEADTNAYTDAEKSKLSGIEVGAEVNTSTFTLPVNLPTYTVAGLPAGSERDVVYCSDGDAGSKCLAVYDGADWLRVSLGAAVSAT